MREIKFRYTCKRDNGHVFSCIFTLDEIQSGAALNWLNLNFVGMFHLHREQFTGLHDKNGKEIYEGDIVSGHPYSIDPVEVYWDEGQCGFEVRWDLWSSHFINWSKEYDIGHQPFEVIGNIYETPELVRSKKEFKEFCERQEDGH